ncbi:predicted protein [Nematostella vectensis]|uniref:Uncharacterized protein n=1 Tax=Nematostella vectensis TaxID=45351 RepID=A7STB7_NEMVE|nr:predicted protein [Nematostella vectensis]|eukprot:XP_001625153.1 predicted protein [Nematostella vectensis]
MDTLVIQHLRQKEEEREAVLKKALGKELILRIPEEEALAMKADLRLPWFAFGKVRRDKNVILFAFGDYEYICRMLGIFGASALDSFSSFMTILIAKHKAKSSGEQTGDTDFDQYVKTLHSAERHREKASKLRKQAKQAQEHITFKITNDGLQCDEEYVHPYLTGLVKLVGDLSKRAANKLGKIIFFRKKLACDLVKDLEFDSARGKIHQAMEQQLQQINIVRQAYHSNSYVGNHVNIALKLIVLPLEIRPSVLSFILSSGVQVLPFFFAMMKFAILIGRIFNLKIHRHFPVLIPKSKTDQLSSGSTVVIAKAALATDKRVE